MNNSSEQPSSNNSSEESSIKDCTIKPFSDPKILKYMGIEYVNNRPFLNQLLHEVALG